MLGFSVKYSPAMFDMATTSAKYAEAADRYREIGATLVLRIFGKYIPTIYRLKRWPFVTVDRSYLYAYPSNPEAAERFDEARYSLYQCRRRVAMKLAT